MTDPAPAPAGPQARPRRKDRSLRLGLAFFALLAGADVYRVVTRPSERHVADLVTHLAMIGVLGSLVWGVGAPPGSGRYRAWTAVAMVGSVAMVLVFLWWFRYTYRG